MVVAGRRLPVAFQNPRARGEILYRTEFENLRIYQLAEEIADLVWKVVGAWGRLAQETVGIQFIKSADSMGANIAGRLPEVPFLK
jgi:hypothetical protein